MISAQLPDAMRQISGLLQSGDYRAAHDRLEVIASTNPDYAEARRLLAGAKLALGDAAGAEQVLRAAAALDPVWPPTLTMLGELLLNGGRQTEAEQFLLRAATGAPADPRAALVLARRCNDTRRHAQALAVAAPFCVTGNAAPELATQHVTSLVALGRKDEAIAFYRRLAADSPDNAAAAHALAVALQAADRHGEAESVARRTRAREPQTAAFSYTHARSLVALGAFDRAEAALRDCLRADPQHVDAHGDLARLIWMRAGDSAEATAELDRALQSSPGNDALWAAKAAVLQGAGDPRAAYACLAARVERPQSPPALQVRAGLAALEFDPRIALERAERALRATPDDVAARTLQVAALLGVGAADAALPACEALRVASPDDQYLIALQTTAWRMLGDERYARLCDYRNLVVPYRLEAPPAWQSQADFLGDLKRSLEKLHAAHRHPLLFQSLRHGTETTEDLVHSGDPAVRALFGAFDAPIRDYIARMGQSDDPLRRRNTGAYHFNGSWSVRLRSDGFHHNHVHPRGWISSACYIDLPDSMADATTREGVLTFAEPGILTMPALAAQHEVRPEAGMLVLFPSYFWHGTVPISGEQTRLTVAFDAVPGR
ncbi:MAG: tetratricopeptide repeat protein [Xanthomonadales bacterium]|nr:tetratricopeptide repeat protein [Xanthomonadales bacterium]